MKSRIKYLDGINYFIALNVIHEKKNFEEVELENNL